MALEPNKEEKLEDLSFLNRKRSPKMKDPSEVKSPFSDPEKPGQDLPRQEGSEPEAQSVQVKRDSQVKIGPARKKEAGANAPANRSYKNLQLSGDEIKSLIQTAGPDKAAYALLLKSSSDEANRISISYKETSQLFGLKSEKSAKGILSFLEKVGLLKLTNKADINQGKPTTYQIQF